MKETARIFYQNTDDRITINLYFAGIGVLLGIAGEKMENTRYNINITNNSSHPALYWIWNSLPSALSSLASTVSQVAGGVGGGYGHRHHLSRHGNKHNNLPAYDDYDYNYSAAAEHYVS